MSFGDLVIWNVGQGLFTMAPNDAGGDRRNWSVFDCGTLAQNPLHSTDSILSEAADFLSDTDSIDNIVISHQDDDHWSMLESLLSLYFGVSDGCFFKQNSFQCKRAGNAVELIRVLEDGRISIKHKFFWENASLGIDYTIYKTEDDTYVVTYLQASYSKGYAYLSQSLEGTKLKGSVSNAPIFEKTLDAVDPVTVSNVLKDEQYREAWENYIPPWERYMTLGADIANLCENLAGDLESYEDYVDEVSAGGQEVNGRPAIRQVVWGGRNATAGCQAMRYLLQRMQEVRLITSYKEAASGNFYEVTGSGTNLTNYMNFSCYDKNLLDVKKKNITADEIEKNVTSVVTYLMSGNNWRCLLPGDLTVHAFHKLREVLHTYYSRESNMSTLLVAPHHGSGNTNFCLLPTGRVQQPLEALLDELFAGHKGSVVVSALISEFGHPSRRFMDLAVEKSQKGVAEHKICCDDGGEVLIGNTDSSVYCTEELDTIAEDFDYTDWYYTYPSLPGSSENESASRALKDSREMRRTPSKRLFL